MKDEDKSKEQLMVELTELRRQVAALEASAADCKRIEADLRDELAARKLAEVELRRNEAQLSQAAANIPGAVFQFLLKKDGSQEFPYVSEGGYDFFGLSPAEIQADSARLFALIHPDDAERMQQAIRESARTMTGYRFDNRVCKRDGTVVWMRVGSTPQRLANGDILWNGVAIDVTEQKQLEADLWLKSEALENIVEGVSLTTSGTEGVFVYATPSFEAMFGYEPGELIGQHVSIINAPAEKSPREKAGEITQKVREEGSWEGEIQNIKKDGAIVWCYAKVTCFKHPHYGQVWVSVHEDITERKRADETLRESESRYRCLFEDAGVALWEEDFSEVKRYIDQLRVAGIEDVGRFFENHRQAVAACASMVKIIDVNEAALRLFKARSKEQLLKRLIEVLPEESINGFKAELIALAEGRLTSQVMSIKRNLQGDKIQVIVKWSIPPGYEDTWSKVLVSIVDVTELKRMEEALQDSRDTLVMAQEIANLGSWTWDIKTNKVFWSGQFYRILGLEPEKFEPSVKTYRRLVHPDDLEREREASRRALSSPGNNYSIEHRIVRPDGSIRVVHSQGKVTAWDEQGQPIHMLGTTQDITDRRRTEEEVRRLADVVNNMGVGLHLYHLEDIEDDRTLRMVACNLAAAQFTGLAKVDVLGKTLDENFPGLRKQGIPQLYAEVVRSSKPVELEEFYYGDGRVTPGAFLVKAFPLPNNHVGVVFENITERKLMEASLRESEEKYRSLYTTMTEGVVLHEIVYSGSGEAVDYIILDINPSFESITGLTREQAIGVQASDLYGTGQPPYLDIYAAVAVSGQPTSFETYFPPLEKHFNISVFSPGQGKFATVFEDITAHKRTEAQVKASLQEKEILLKEIHHRVKNNLFIVSSLLELQAETIQDEQTRAVFRESQSRIYSMAHIHEHLYGSEDLVRIDMARYIHSLGEYLRQSYDSNGVTLITDVAEVRLDIDTAIPCGLIINELVSNSLKYAFPPGRNGSSPPAEVCIKLSAEDEAKLLLLVSDNGVGLPPDWDRREGSSLGLELVDRLSRQLRGRLEIEAGAAGTTFKIKFAKPEMTCEEVKP